MSDDHKQRFDALLKRAVGDHGLPPVLTTFDVSGGSPTVTLGEVVTSSTVTQQQIDAFVKAALRGEICGL